MTLLHPPEAGIKGDPVDMFKYMKHHWLVFPFPFKAVEDTQEWKTIWRDALRRASVIYEDHVGYKSWYVFINTKNVFGWMYEIAGDMGIVKFPKTAWSLAVKKPLSTTDVVFYLASPTKKWLKSRVRLNRSITKRTRPRVNNTR